MSASLLLALSLACGAPGAGPGAGVGAADRDSTNDPAVIWNDGSTYAVFTSHFDSRKSEWLKRDGWAAIPDSLAANERFNDRRARYEHDRGRSAMAEWIPMLECVARGETACAAKVAP